MKLGSLNGLRGKRLSLTLIIIFTTFLIWGWERKPHRESFRQPQEEDLFLQDSETIGHRSSETELQSDKPVGSTTLNKATRVDRDFESVPSTTLNK